MTQEGLPNREFGRNEPILRTTNSEFEACRHRLAVGMRVKTESQALGHDLHAQIVAQHLRRHAADFFIARHLDYPAEQARTQSEILVVVRDHDRYFRFIADAQFVEPAYSDNSWTVAILRIVLRHQDHLPVVVSEANADKALMGDAGAEFQRCKYRKYTVRSESVL